MRSTKTEILEDLRSHWLPGLDPLNVTRNNQSQERTSVAFRGSQAQPQRRSNVSFDVELSIKRDSPEWPVFDSTPLLHGQSLTQRLDRNLQAIACMKALREQPRSPTVQERQLMLGYAGWSGAARMFESLAANSLVQYRQSLSAMVSARDLAGARTNVARAIFPSLLTVNAVWRLICKLGFKGGRVVDPTAGAGHLLSGIPQGIALQSEITAVEQDPIAAGLLELTFADLGVRVQCSPIENAIAFNGYYDLALSIVPWNGPKPQESANVAYAKWDTPNYLIGKSIDLVRPGGLVVLLAPSVCLDSQQQRHRDWIDLDLNDPETMAFDEAPDDFVMLDASPIVFTIRGLQHLTPRFKSVGYDIANISTPEQFKSAYDAWSDFEVTLLGEKIASRANATSQPNEHKILLAAMQGNYELADAEAKRLIHKKRANLKLWCPD